MMDEVESESESVDKTWPEILDFFVPRKELIDEIINFEEKKFDVLITDHDIPSQVLKIIEASCNVHYLPEGHNLSKAPLFRMCQLIHGIYIYNPLQIDHQFLKRTETCLRVISVVGHDVSFIDLQQAKKQKIKIGTSGCESITSGAEVAVAMAVTLGRRIKDGHYLQTQRVNNSSLGGINPPFGNSLNDAIMGIIGLGKLGMAIARKLHSFHPNCIAYYSRRVKPYAKKVCAERVLLEDIISECDFIFICCPFSEKCRHLFKTDTFNKMKPNAVLINMSHLGFVNLDDLYCALKKKKIAAAGMDCDLTESPPIRHPILKLQNFLLTPHQGEQSCEAYYAMSILAAKNLVAGLQDKPMPSQFKYELPSVETEEERCQRVQEDIINKLEAEVLALLQERNVKQELPEKVVAEEETIQPEELYEDFEFEDFEYSLHEILNQ